MKLTIDTDQRTLAISSQEGMQTLDLYSAEAFVALSRHWLRAAWANKYTYAFTWLGRPIIQLPEDLLRIQELIYQLRPDVIVETGIAHGGSLIFYASLCRLMGTGRVIGIDVEIRPHNRAALDAHPLRPLITLVEASSTDPATVARVRSLIGPRERVMVILDSDHAYRHVTAELEAYAGLVSPGCYLIVQDGLMRDLWDVPGGQAAWKHDNPARAALDFVARHPEYAVEPPARAFNESPLAEGPTQWPDGWLRRRAS
jgi:cephalosporin hydroxylase